MKSREAIATLALTLKGKNEKDGSFKSIIDGYNSHSPIPRNYKVKYTDNWCATFVSFLAISLGYTDIIPIECSCGRLVELAKQMGIWNENDAYTPSIGDIILYDWQDSGVGDDTGWPDHVGIVVKVKDKTIYVIEGNKSEAVGERRILVNAKNIRGYITPNYDSAAEVDPVPQIVAPAQPVNPIPQPVTQPQNVPSFVIGNTYKLKYEIKVREGAGTNFRAKSHAELTSDGQNHDDDGDGALNAGTVVTCKETMQIGNDVWMRTPSGWIAARYQGNRFVK